MSSEASPPAQPHLFPVLSAQAAWHVGWAKPPFHGVDANKTQGRWNSASKRLASIQCLQNNPFGQDPAAIALWPGLPLDIVPFLGRETHPTWPLLQGTGWGGARLLSSSAASRAQKESSPCRLRLDRKPPTKPPYTRDLRLTLGQWRSSTVDTPLHPLTLLTTFKNRIPSHTFPTTNFKPPPTNTD